METTASQRIPKNEQTWLPFFWLGTINSQHYPAIIFYRWPIPLQACPMTTGQQEQVSVEQVLHLSFADSYAPLPLPQLLVNLGNCPMFPQSLLPDSHDDIQSIGVVGQAQPIRISRPVHPFPLGTSLLLATAVSLVIYPSTAMQRGDRFLPGCMTPLQSSPTRQTFSQLWAVVVSGQVLIGCVSNELKKG